MKEYKKFMKEIAHDSDFELIKNGNKSTIKLVHKESKQLYSIHPGDNAIAPLRKWMKKQKK